MPFLVPGQVALDKFQKFVILLFQQLRNLRQKNNNLRQTRDPLLPRLISGELDVSGLEVDTGFRSTALALKRHPISQGKEATFWHSISEGKKEEDRLPDLRRCERIRWPRPIIEHSCGGQIKVWENERRGETRICLWLECCEYLVVLAKRRGYILLWTAYLVTYSHQKRKLQKEYEAYKKANAAP